MNLETLRTRYRDDILAIADKYGAENVRVFGSVLRGDADEDSDVDFLMRFRPGTTLLQLCALERELRGLLATEVDIVSERGVSMRLKENILDRAKPL